MKVSSPLLYRYNEIFAQFAGQIGIPLLAMGFMEGRAIRSANPLNDTQTIFALCVPFLATVEMGAFTKEMYTTLVGVVSMGFIAEFGYSSCNQLALYVLGWDGIFILK